MTSKANTLWTVSVSAETDAAIRGFLAQRGPGRDDLSKFIEDAVRWRLLDQTVGEARRGFADLQGREVEALVDEALGAVRFRAGSRIAKASG